MVSSLLVFLQADIFGGQNYLTSPHTVQLCNSRQVTFLYGHQRPLISRMRFTNSGPWIAAGLSAGHSRTFFKKCSHGFPLGILLCSILFIRETVATIKNKSLNFSGLKKIGQYAHCQIIRFSVFVIIFYIMTNTALLNICIYLVLFSWGKVLHIERLE